MPLQITVGAEHREGLMEDVLVGNTEYHNGGMRLAPGALPDDGLFDVLLIGNVTKVDLALNLHKLYRGTFLPHPRAELLRGSTVTVESAAPLPIELDGEQPGTTPVSLRGRAGARCGVRVARRARLGPRGRARSRREALRRRAFADERGFDAGRDRFGFARSSTRFSSAREAPLELLDAAQLPLHLVHALGQGR